MENEVKTSLSEIRNTFNDLQEICLEYDKYSESKSDGVLMDIAERIETKQQDLDEPLYIMIVGKGKQGKSTLLNALMGQNVAEVSRIPKTWKIDIFQSTEKKENYAELEYLKNGKKDLKKETFDKAIEICKKEEEEAEKNNVGKEREAWKSDLRAAKWYINSQWPKKGIAIVDTPGFGQLRADTSIGNSNLYGAQAVEVERNDGFEYYYYRANFVLWCIEAGKLDDGEALEKLKEVHSQGKTIIGIITKIDLDDRWERREEILAVAKRNFGAYIDKFLFCGAKLKYKGDEKEEEIEKSEKIKNETISIIRNEVENLVRQKGNTVKIDESLSAINTFKLKINEILEKSGSVFAKNCVEYAKALDNINKGIEMRCDKLYNDVSNYIEKCRKEALGKVESAYEASGGNEEDFRIGVSAAVGVSKVNEGISTKLKFMQKDIESYTNKVLGSINWASAVIGSGKSTTKYELAKTSNFDISGSMGGFYFSMDDDYMGTGVGVGIGAAAAGAFLLGPIGLLAGGIGYLVGMSKKRREYIQKGKSAINDGFDTLSRDVLKKIEKIQPQITKSTTEMLNKTFKGMNGGDLDEVRTRVEEMDISLNKVGINQENCKQLVYSENNKMYIGYSKIYHLLVSGLTEDNNIQRSRIERYVKYHFEKFNEIVGVTFKKELSNIEKIPFSCTEYLFSKIENNPKLLLEGSFSGNKYFQDVGMTSKFERDIAGMGINLDLQRMFRESSKVKNASLLSSYERVINEWDKKVRNEIEIYISKLVNPISKEMEKWAIECDEILNSEIIDRIHLFDFSNYLKTYYETNALAARLYKKDKKLIGNDVLQWKFAKGESCQSHIFYIFETYLNKYLEDIKEKEKIYKGKWDSKIFEYCKNQIKNKFNVIKEASVSLTEKELKNNIKSRFNEYVGETGMNGEDTAITLTKGFVASKQYTEYIDGIVDNEFSMKNLCCDFINQKFVNSGFNMYINKVLSDICKKARNSYKKELTESIKNKSQNLVCPTTKKESVMNFVFGLFCIFLFLMGIFEELAVNDDEFIVLAVGIFVLGILFGATTPGKYKFELIVIPLVALGLGFVDIMFWCLAGVIFIVISIIFAAIKSSYCKNISCAIADTKTPDL